MGHGIAQVCAMAGYRVRITDVDPEGLKHGVSAIARNLAHGIELGKVTEEERYAALVRLTSEDRVAAVAEDADIVFEAIPEDLELKRALFRDLEGAAPPACIFATNTSSLSIARISEAVHDPGRVIGTHFFNPVHIMKLLEVVIGDATRAEVLEAVRVLGERIGKEVITVRDVPGFATSRLGICLGMEAIRMVEQGVASPEDIDKAMVLGYRHPVGPLRLGDLVGLDVRLAIGEYLARELHNPAFEPPALLREMVARGDLGKKSGRGFYEW